MMAKTVQLSYLVLQCFLKDFLSQLVLNDVWVECICDFIITVIVCCFFIYLLLLLSCYSTFNFIVIVILCL